jgi:hypothetical protein
MQSDQDAVQQTDYPAMLDQVDTILANLLAGVEPDLTTPPGRGRPSILPDLALWRLLTRTGLWRYPRYAVCDQAVYRRLAHGGTAVLEQLFAQVGQLLATRLAPARAQRVVVLDRLAPFASDIVALVETTLHPVARRLPVRMAN